MQAAGGLVGLAVELAARVQGAEDDFERGFVGEFRVGVDRDAAAVVADGERAVGVKLDLDAGGVAGDRLVHRVVDDLGGEVVAGALVDAADVHAGAEADGLERFQHFDGGCVVGLGLGGEEVGGHVPARCWLALLEHRGVGRRKMWWGV